MQTSFAKRDIPVLLWCQCKVSGNPFSENVEKKGYERQFM